MDGPEITSAEHQGIDDEMASTLRLSMLPGIGPRTLTALIDTFGSPRRVLDAEQGQLAAVPGVGPKLIHTIRGVGYALRQND